jgi:hypothetical protein
MNKKTFLETINNIAREMADEAEHQDGTDYWKQYKTQTDAVLDFALYLQGLCEPIGCSHCGKDVNGLQYHDHMLTHHGVR